MKKAVLWLIRGYKRFFSIGYSCRFVPTCSEYMYEAIDKYGVLKGGWMGIKRIGRCRPGGGSGIDLIQ